MAMAAEASMAAAIMVDSTKAITASTDTMVTEAAIFTAASGLTDTSFTLADANTSTMKAPDVGLVSTVATQFAIDEIAEKCFN
jgi:hypothetical protein